MAKSKVPHITDTELIREVANRTGLPINATFQAIYAYYEVVKECIANGVEVKMGELGTMKWRVLNPTFGKSYYDFYTKEKMRPKDNPGYWVPKFVPRQQWKKELREITEFWETNEEKKESEDGE